MHTDSSASLTYFASVSASECTTTVRMPSSRHARWMRSAISPRLAIRIFSNMPSADDEKRLTVLHGLAAFHQNRLHRARRVGFDLVHELHRFDDADRLPLLYRLSDLDERLGVWGRRAVEGPDHGSLDDMSFLTSSGRLRRSRKCRGTRFRRWRRGDSWNDR